MARCRYNPMPDPLAHRTAVPPTIPYFLNRHHGRSDREIRTMDRLRTGRFRCAGRLGGGIFPTQRIHHRPILRRDSLRRPAKDNPAAVWDATRLAWSARSRHANVPLQALRRGTNRPFVHASPPACRYPLNVASELASPQPLEQNWSSLNEEDVWMPAQGERGTRRFLVGHSLRKAAGRMLISINEQ
jgi:hypothetical protein